MPVLSYSPSGKVVLNPPNVLQLVNDSPMKNAALVIRGIDVIVSTGPATHNEMMDAAGIQENPYDLRDINLKEATFRGTINEGGLSFHIWNRKNKYEIDAHIDAFQAMYDFLTQHQKLRRGPSLEIVISDADYVVTHFFCRDGLTAAPNYGIGI